MKVLLNSGELTIPTWRFELTPQPKSTLTLKIPLSQLGGLFLISESMKERQTTSCLVQVESEQVIQSFGMQVGLVTYR